MKVTDLEIAKTIIANEAFDCVIGTESEFPDSSQELFSCIGGIFWGKHDEKWPVNSVGSPLIPWLQIVCTEIDGLIGGLFNKKLACFYIDEDFSDYEEISEWNNADFVVRIYSQDDILVPLKRPAELTGHQCYKVAWEKTKDYPSTGKYLDVFSSNVIDELERLEDQGLFEFSNKSGIKLGGWPTPIQGHQEYPYYSLIQIDVTKNYMYMDSGIAYIRPSNDKWYVQFECM